MKKNLLSILGNGLLVNLGDKYFAEITASGKEVAKLHKADGRKISQVRYPSTGKIVTTISE